MTHPCVEEDPAGSHWNVLTYQGESKLEECEEKAPKRIPFEHSMGT